MSVEKDVDKQSLDRRAVVIELVARSVTKI
jgi:hypothetical protein